MRTLKGIILASCIALGATMSYAGDPVQYYAQNKASAKVSRPSFLNGLCGELHEWDQVDIKEENGITYRLYSNNTKQLRLNGGFFKPDCPEYIKTSIKNGEEKFYHKYISLGPLGSVPDKFMW
jgi:hypothetical protein